MGVRTARSDRIHHVHRRGVAFCVGVGVSIVSLVSLTACAGPNATAGGSSTDGDTLTMGVASAPSSLNPAISGNGSDLYYQELAYEPLIKYNRAGKPAAGLATKWAYVGRGNKLLEITIRSNAKFADGTPVTAEAVVNSLNYFAKNGKGPSSAAFSTLTASKVNATTVDIKSTVANPVITDLISTRFLGGNIISPAGLKDPSKLTGATFGAGPYVLDTNDSVSGDHYTFKPNPYYYDPSEIHFKEVILKVIVNPNSTVQALRAGEIDAADGDITTQAAARSGNLRVLTAPTSWVGAFIVDNAGVESGALGKLAVRQAMNYAVDRSSLAKAVYGKFGSPTDQPNTPGNDAFSATAAKTYSYNPGKAKQLLASAGYPHGFSFTWNYPTFEPATATVVQAMAAQLAKVGIKADLVSSPNIAELLQQLNTKKISVWSLDWGGQSQFANVSQCWLPNAAINPFRNKTTGLMAAFDAYAAASPGQRNATAQAVEKLVVDQALALPAVQGDGFFYASRQLKGVQLQQSGYINNAVFWSK